MSKGLQISLLVGLFALSTAAGYFISDMLFPKESKEVVKVEKQVVEEPVKSSLPVIHGVNSSWSEALKVYTITVDASVETDDQLKYYLYTDEACKMECDHGFENEFDVNGTDDGNYYIKVVNNRTQVDEAYYTISDCKKPAEKPTEVVRPLTESKVQNSINSTEDGLVPSDCGAYFAAHQTVKVLNDSVRSYDDFAAVWLDKFMGHINSVQVVKLHYNGYNRVYQMDINVY